MLRQNCRKLDRLIRWNCFLHMTNQLWQEIAEECYGESFDIDSDAGQRARLRIFDSVKGYKNKTLNFMEVDVIFKLFSSLSYGDRITWMKYSPRLNTQTPKNCLPHVSF